jgi:hypothetical protein
MYKTARCLRQRLSRRYGLGSVPYEAVCVTNATLQTVNAKEKEEKH